MHKLVHKFVKSKMTKIINIHKLYKIKMIQPLHLCPIFWVVNLNNYDFFCIMRLLIKENFYKL
jgi:hypothetical protein